MKSKSIKYLSKEDFNRLRNVISDKRDGLILEILYECGCTINELINLHKNDFNFESRTLFFSEEGNKSNHSRTSLISKELSREIKNSFSFSDSEWMFPTRQSSKITTKRVRQLIQYYSKKAGLGKINPQVIRYTHIAHALEKGIPLTMIQRQVGMERLRMVQIYESLVPEEQEKLNYDKFWSGN